MRPKIYCNKVTEKWFILKRNHVCVLNEIKKLFLGLVVVLRGEVQKCQNDVCDVGLGNVVKVQK